MRFCHLMGCLSACVLAAVLIVTLAPAAGAQGRFHFEFVPPQEGMTRYIPPDGSTWHELYPTMCIMHEQTGYEDNGDGFVGECDHIYIDEVRFHITWAGPTYVLETALTEDGRPRVDKFVEPVGVASAGRNPICEIWHEIWPEYCLEWHVEDWEDNGDGYVSPCDWVLIWDGLGEPQQWHVIEVNLNIITMPDSPVEDSTWGKIKAFFADIF